MSRGLPPIRTPGLDHQKIFLEDSVARKSEINRFNKRLRIGIILMVIASLIASTFYFSKIWQHENKSLETRLETYTELRSESLSRFLESLESEVRIWSGHKSIVKDAELFIADFKAFSPEEVTALRALYINEAAPASMSPAFADYIKIHDEYHPNLDNFNRHHGYYDVFIFDLDGNLVYSVEKEDDFAYNFAAGGGPYADTGLGKVYRKALAAKTADEVVFVDFEPYAPSNDDPAAFLSSQIVDAGGALIGVYAVQVPIDRFNEVLQFDQGLGDTGESYLVGQNEMMYSQSRLTEEATMLVRPVKSPAVKAALEGRRSLQKSKNLTGEPTIVAAMPLSFKDAHYVVATEMEIQEKRAPLRPYIAVYLASLVFMILFGFVMFALLKARATATDKYAKLESS